jgi:hydroxymethylglutaryl-CoA lyase
VISYLFSNLIPNIQILSLNPPTYYIDKWFEKIDAAYKAGCIRYDGAYKVWRLPNGKDDLTGNMPTEKLLSYFTANKVALI